MRISLLSFTVLSLPYVWSQQATACNCDLGQGDLATESCTGADDASLLQSVTLLESSFAQAERSATAINTVVEHSAGTATHGIKTRPTRILAKQAIVTIGASIVFVCAVIGVSLIGRGRTSASAAESPEELLQGATSGRLPNATLPGRAVSFGEAKSPTMLQKVGQSACCSPSSRATSSAQERLMPGGASCGSLDSSHSLAGKWLMYKTEGDVDAFLEEVGVGCVARSFAMAGGYGAGSHTMEFRSNGDNMFDVVENKLVTATYTWHIGGGWQRYEGQAGAAMVEPFWDLDGVSVSANCRGLDDQYPFTTSFKLLSLNEFVEISIPQSGRQASFVYKRQCVS